MTALASRLAPFAAFAAAIALLAACGGETTTADGFKPVPVTPVLGDVPLGNMDSKVVVEEYASLACPHCRDFWKQDFPRLKANYIDTGKIKYIYRDFMIDSDLSLTLAAVARCKGEKTYYDLIDDIFTNQYDIETAARSGGAGAQILAVAARHGLSPDEVRTCIDADKQLRDSIMKSHEDGAKRGVDSTPTVFVNGVKVEDHSYEKLSAYLDSKLNPGAAPVPATSATPSPTTPGATPAPAAPAPATPASSTTPAPKPAGQ